MKISPLFLVMALYGCTDQKAKKVLLWGTSADYPPFEYLDKGVISGFEIELAQCIGKVLGKPVVFENIPFCTLLVALQSGSLDGVAATLTVTAPRKASFDFSRIHYVSAIAAVYYGDTPPELAHKKIACQMGTTMEMWIKEHVPTAEVIAIDHTTQAIEALKAGHAEVALMEKAQAHLFCEKNPELRYHTVGQADHGYAMAFRKGSPLKQQVDQALQHLEETGVLEALKQKWHL